MLVEAVLGAMRAVSGELDPVLAATDAAEEVVDVLVAAVEQYTGTDPMSLLFVEGYLAATRDDPLRAGIAAVLAELRGVIGGRLRQFGVADPDGTATVLGAAMDGLLMHRAVAPDAVPNTTSPARCGTACAASCDPTSNGPCASTCRPLWTSGSARA